MKFLTLLTLFALSALFACNTQTDLPESLSQLWYSQPAEKWTEALPIGNGRLGAMIYGGVTTDHIQFNEETLWTGEPRDYQREGAYQYLPQIRKLLFEGKQAEADQLAEAQFMGKRNNEDHYEEELTAWVKKVTRVSENSPASAAFNENGWKEMKLPASDGWETQDLANLDGAVWFRKKVEVPASWKGKTLTLELGKISDDDYTYFNGKKVGATAGKDHLRRYKIPASLVQEGPNTIAVQIINYTDKGGFRGFNDDHGFIALYPANASQEEKINLNGNWKYAVRDNQPPLFPKYQETYQPFGDVWLAFKNQTNPEHYRRALDISQAVSKVSYEVDGITYTREYLVSEPDQVLAIHLTASKKGTLSFEAKLNSPHPNAATKKIDDHTLGLAVAVRGGALQGESYLNIQASGGAYTVADDKITVDQANEVTLYLAAGTNYVNYKDVSGNPATRCQQALQGITDQSYEDIKNAHVQEYQQYFNTLSVNMGTNANDSLPTDVRLNRFAASPDPAFVALYLQYGRYLLISSSRPGTQPANLQGIWNDLLTPPWDSKYTTNINAEMNYWPAELLNLSACHEPLFQMIKELAETGQKTAKAHYNAPGWVSHHNTDLWRGTAPINAANHGIWVTGGAWMCQHLWEHFQFTQDTTFLRKEGYPIMKEAARFFVDFLVKDPKTGWLISSPSNSPENGGLVAGPTMDHQIIRALFQNCIKASEILKTDAEFRATLIQKYEQIAPNQIGKHKQLQEWLQDVDDPENHHRHVSHLWAVYPGNEITWEKNLEMMKAARQSLMYRGDEGTGWSLAWKINFWARFKDGDHAFNMIKMLLSPAEDPKRDTRGGSYPNLFDAHPPFQIDGNFGGAAGIAELLVQSHTGAIDILPALPADLPAGEIKGLRARGGFELNMRWKAGKLEQLEVISKAGIPCTIRYMDQTKEFKTEKGKAYQLDKNLQFM